MSGRYEPRGVTVGVHLAGLVAMLAFFSALLAEDFTSWTFPFWLATSLLVLMTVGVGAGVRIWFKSRGNPDDD